MLTADLLRVVICYEVYETSFYGVVSSVRLCLSYDYFKLDFINFKADNCSTENAWLK